MNRRIVDDYFRGKRILITGGSSGIGKGLAHALAPIAEVGIVAQREDTMRATVDEFAESGWGVHPFLCDLSKPHETVLLAERVLDKWGAPDVIVNNAGFATYTTFEEMKGSEIEALMEVNLTSCMRLAAMLLPPMVRRRSGSVVNIASIAGRLALTPNSVYCTAKHGMVAWSECLNYELARYNIQVSVICPGRVLTSFFDDETFRRRAARPEVRYTIPLAQVVDGTLNAVARGRFLTYVPRSLGMLAWAKQAFPFIVGPLYRRLMLQRIETFYGTSEGAQ